MQEIFRANFARWIPRGLSRCCSSVSKLSIEGTGRKSIANVTAAGDVRSTKGSKEMSLLPPKGTRDFYPDDLRKQQWLFGIWRDTASLCGFEEYDAPVVEYEDLYKRKAGDDISQQLYNFEDKNGRRLSLRPEMTPSLARMVLGRQGTLPLPLKWFSIPQCWRYERMSRGRRREHYQWNMDIWGVSETDAEGELISAVVLSLQRMGLSAEDVGIKVNSRQLLQKIFSLAEIQPEHFLNTCLIVDKMHKLAENDFLLQLAVQANISEHQAQALVSMLKEKDYTKYADATDDIFNLFQHCAAAGISDWVEFDASVVRGLSYYTGVVFEGFDRLGNFRAIFGGGRYDKLLENFGARQNIPAVGFGFGDAVIMELLESKGLAPRVATANSVQVVVVALGDASRAVAIKCTAALRAHNLSVELYLRETRMKRVLQLANRLSAASVVVFSDAENGDVQAFWKCMRSGNQDHYQGVDVIEEVCSKIVQSI